MNVEALEGRRLFSVTVTEGYPGFYQIHGDGSANTIEVFVSQLDETFTLDGVTYGGVADITVHGYGGNDAISVAGSDNEEGWIGASVSGGDGDDSITVDLDGAIWAGPGDDVLHLSNAFRGEAYGEGGGDRIYIAGGCVDPEIIGGDGDDLLDATQNEYGVTLRGGMGDDTILGSNFDDEIYGDEGRDALHGGGGDDTFYAFDGDADTVFGGGGTDTLYGDLTDTATDGDVEFVYLA
jgi:Ca2+-binding RTX toxin-like protein